MNDHARLLKPVYDADHDVLYVSFADAPPSLVEDTDDPDLFLDWALHEDTVTGFVFLYPRRRRDLKQVYNILSRYDLLTDEVRRQIDKIRANASSRPSW